jgi:hypothetical protein
MAEAGMVANFFTSAWQLLASQLDAGHQVIGGVLTLFVCMSLWAVGWNRRQIAAKKPGMASLPIILACFAIALIAIGGAAYGLGARFSADSAEKNSVEKTAVKFISDQGVAVSYTSGPSDPDIAPLTYSGKFSTIGTRLQIFVDILDFSVEGDRPQVGSTRIKIAEVKDFVRGQMCNIPLMLRHGKDTTGSWIIKWANGDQIQRSRFAARVALIDNNGTEQHYYFMIVPALINNERYIDVIKANEFNFAENWEKADAQK